VRHEADDLAWSEVVSGLLIRLLVKTADQVLENVTHRKVVDARREALDVRRKVLGKPIRVADQLGEGVLAAWSDRCADGRGNLQTYQC
jgi:hypothetical protein